MAEPKKRTNNSKQGMRRMHDKVNSGAVVFCEKCHEPKERHKVCYNCGSYKDATVIDFAAKEAKKHDHDHDHDHGHEHEEAKA